jgi:S-adenosylmethionine synthetase
VPEAKIMRAVSAVFDLTPKGIIAALDLRKPIYTATAAYGHFGRTPERLGSGKSARTQFSWERTDRAGALKKAVRDGTTSASNGSGRSGKTAAFATTALEDPN